VSERVPLREVLARVSRSFYLSLWLLPEQTRFAVALAYLLARAADTIADTRLVARERRLDLLLRFRAACSGEAEASSVDALLNELADLELSDDAIQEEQELLRELRPCLRALDELPELEATLIRRVLQTLTEGMVADLEAFPGEDANELAALETRSELLHYTYQVAGCVGEFWSLIHAARLPALGRRVQGRLDEFCRSGVRLGRALQLTNVLRDVRRDLQHGRCYLPKLQLSALGLSPGDLLDPAHWTRVRPLYQDLVAQAVCDARAGLEHVLAVPSTFRFLRLAELLPLLLALRTLGLAFAENPLAEGSRRKVARSEVYRLLAKGLWLAGDDAALRRWCRAEARRAGLEAYWA
jgi:farnesyl-diphosphate farnesyltransferase